MLHKKVEFVEAGPYTRYWRNNVVLIKKFAQPDVDNHQHCTRKFEKHLCWTL